MLPPEVVDLVNNIRLGFVATVNPDRTPNLSPKGTLLALDDKHLFFANIASPNTIRNIESNPSVEINVVDFFKRKGYRFKAHAEVIRDGEKFTRALNVMIKCGIDPKRYSINEIAVMEILEYSAIFSPAYDIGETEKTLREFYKIYYNDHL